jgi:uncharacterized membrane protein YfcA
MITDPAFYVVAVLAVILLGLGKGGFAGIGALSLPLLALAISPIKGAAIMLPILIVQDVVSVSAFWKKWSWPNLWILFPSSFLGIFVAYLLAAYISEGAFELALGIISFVFGLRNITAKKEVPPRTPSALEGWFWGWMSGFTSMISNTGAPPLQIYLTPQKLPRDIFVGTTSLFFAVINWVKVPPFFALGQFTNENLWTSVVLMPLAIASTFAGVWLVKRVPTERFYTIIFCLMLLVGIKLIYDGIAALI